MDDISHEQQKQQLGEEEQQQENNNNNNNIDLTKSYDSMSIIDAIEQQNINEQPEKRREEEEEKLQQNELNEDDYDILNKNDELSTMMDTKLNEINDKISIEELNSQQGKEEEEENSSKEPPVLDILGNNSLVKKVLIKGDADNRPKNGQMCTISYELRLESNLDEVIENCQAFEFILGDGDVVPAIDIAVSLMDLNEECELTTDSRHAYGEKGELPKIPPNARLVYKLKLEKFEYGPDFKELETIERLSLADSKKQRGNYHYNRQNYELAAVSYKKGLKLFLDYNLKGTESKEDLDKFNELKVSLNMNVALCNYKLQSYPDALEALDNVLKHQQKHVKALFIKGKILLHTGEIAESIQCFNKALEIDDKNADIAKELARAQAKYKVQYAKEKEMYQKMLSGVSSTPEPSAATVTNSKKTKTTTIKSNKKSTGSNNSSFFSYFTAAGLVAALAAVGIAAYAKHKNFI